MVQLRRLDNEQSAFVSSDPAAAVSATGFTSMPVAAFSGYALGEPNIYPAYGDLPSAWASGNPDDPAEFLELGFDNPTPINSVSIYETYKPGAVNKVSVRNPNTGLWEVVWSGTAAPAPEAARIFTVTFPMTTFPVSAVRIDLDSPAVPDWNEIDAVRINTDIP